MKNKPTKTAVGIILLFIILGFFGYYIYSHPQIIHTLSKTNPLLIILILFLYCIMLLIWMEVYNATLSFCSVPLKFSENLLLSIYSTLANYFLPLQSGPGVRAAYLKKRHKVPITSYIFASLIYYGIYAVISATFLFIASSYWWLAIPAAIAVAIFSYIIISLARNKFISKGRSLTFNMSNRKFIRLCLFTLLQLFTQAIIYGTELNSLQIPITIRRVLSYTGAANFSLFVSLTPGAIGFREAFLEFSRSLHHFSTNAIIAANIIDRGVFLIFLLILFIIMITSHAKKRLGIKK